MEWLQLSWSFMLWLTQKNTGVNLFPRATFIILATLGPVNIQYTNLEDKEITKISHLLPSRYLNTVAHSWRHSSVSSARDSHWISSEVGWRKIEGAGGRHSEHFESKIGFFPVHSSCHQYCKYSDNKLALSTKLKTPKSIQNIENRLILKLTPPQNFF